MTKPIRIGTRDSQLALWQANRVKVLLEQNGHSAELVTIKSEGDLDLETPLYAIGVEGIFTRSLDAALLNNRIDVAVHSMKDVPVELPKGIVQAAVSPRASHKDILVYREGVDIEAYFSQAEDGLLLNRQAVIATSSIRRKAQWLNRYPGTVFENLRGNINTRLNKLADSQWMGAIFAAAGLERIGLRPLNSIDLDWMLPAPAQGAIMITAAESNDQVLKACERLKDPDTAIAVRVERDFLSALMGGCSTPISALAVVKNGYIVFKGNIVSPDGAKRADVEKIFPIDQYMEAGSIAAATIRANGGEEIVQAMSNA